MNAKSPRESMVEMTETILPSDANALGTAFGGRVAQWIDVAGAIAAQRHCRQVVVTVSIDDIHFHAPVRLGHIVSLHAKVTAAFRTSLEVEVKVHSEDPLTGERKLTTSAHCTFVAIDRFGHPSEVPALLPETDEERQAMAEAQARRAERLKRRNL